uniref:Argonaute hook domain-containing protein n=1 Tax=Denticeps clupeoides TaxID=299321 RepID=A0AAY4C8R6_9TELE
MEERKREEKRKWEASQTVTESCEGPSSAQTAESLVPAAPPSPCPAPVASAVSSPGGNNAKQASAVANGQPPRYGPREVPPRFRTQQDHKVLLKRGQPLSCMLLGGAGGDSGAPALQAENPTSGPSPSATPPSPVSASWGDQQQREQEMAGSETPAGDAGESGERPQSSSVWDTARARERSPADGGTLFAWDDQGSETVTGPSKSEDGDDGTPGGVGSPSAWSKDASGTESWDAGTEGGTAWGCDGPADKVDAEGWVLGNEGSCSTHEVSQGAREGDGDGSGQPAATGAAPGSAADVADATGSIGSCDSASSENTGDVQRDVGTPKEFPAEEDGRGGASGADAQSQTQPGPELALQSMLKRKDLDPRVLCNTGWGQTQIRQNVAWDVAAERGDRRSAASLNAPAPYSGVTPDPPAHSKHGWQDGPSPPAPQGPAMQNSGALKAAGMEGGLGKAASRGDAQDGPGKGWGNGEQDGEGGQWGGFGEQGSSSSARKGGGGWREDRDAGDWRPEGDRGHREAPAGSAWKESRADGAEETSWGGWEEDRHRKGWGSSAGGGGGGGWGASPHSAQIPNSGKAAAGVKAQSPQQSQAPVQVRADPRPSPEGRGRPGGVLAPNQNQSGGWTSGPVPQAAPAAEASGWEEPSPQSVGRRAEIDDGTAAWGDPNCYNSKNVNLWDNNSSQSQQQQQQKTPLQPQHLGGAPSGSPANRDANSAPSLWGGGAGPSDLSADGGAATWGKTAEVSSGWGDADDCGKGGSWGNRSPNPAKPGSKTMQEGWGERESSMGTSRHSSWEEEDDGPGGSVWNSAGPQGSGSAYNSGVWGHGGKRGNSKGGMKGGDSWVNPMSRQLSSMGILDEDTPAMQNRRMENDKRGMNEYNGEMRKGKGGPGVFRSSGPKDAGPAEAGSYYDKMGVFSGSGGMALIRGMHQAGMHPMNPPQGLRAQVPHQFLSPQVPGSLLKQMPPPSGNVVGGVTGGMFPPQLSPQQLAMLGSFNPHMQQFLACQLLLQQQQQLLQNQRKFPQPIRQQADPQQVCLLCAEMGFNEGLESRGDLSRPVVLPRHLNNNFVSFSRFVCRVWAKQ